jgi:hypothetical protein
MSEPIFEGWAILELMGHRRVAGYVREVAFAGANLARVDIPPVAEGAPSLTQFYGGGSIYCMTPCSEDAARAVALRNQPEPVHTYELPRATRVPASDETERCEHGIPEEERCEECDTEPDPDVDDDDF